MEKQVVEEARLVYDTVLHPFSEYHNEKGIVFDPPVFKQRYERAAARLSHEKWSKQICKIVDFGSAELSLFIFLKNEVIARELIFIDSDEQILQDNLNRIFPVNGDYLSSRTHPLNVKVFVGSISTPDPCLINTDAVIGLEIIEHLYPDVLEAVPYNIFSYIQPKIVIFTTPNADFNVLFKKLDKFRHPDHKFEWTREQFEAWAKNITTRFPNYEVEFEGIGLAPKGIEDYGCCSQLALFVRKDLIYDDYILEASQECCHQTYDEYNGPCTCHRNEYSFGICTYNSYYQSKAPSDIRDEADELEFDNCYKLLANIEYPYFVDTRTEEEKLLHEMQYRLNMFLERRKDECFNFLKNCYEVPLNSLLYTVRDRLPPKEEIKLILTKFNYKIEECLIQETNQIESCIIYESEMESDSDTEASGYESDKNPSESKSQDKEKKVATGFVRAQVQVNREESTSCQPNNNNNNESNNKNAKPLGPKNLNERPNRLSNILSVFDNFDRVNELDAIRREKKFFNFPTTTVPHKEVMRKICQEIVKHPMAGPSREPRRNKPTKKTVSSDSDDTVDAIKSITTCILENSLNTIICKDDNSEADLIEDIMEDHNLITIAENLIPTIAPLTLDSVENQFDSNLNNLPESFETPAISNNFAVTEMVVVDDDVFVEPENQQPSVEVDEGDDVEGTWSSREALFDANSQVDLLDEFDLEGAHTLLPTTVDVGTDNISVLPQEDNAFPNWLLQIFEEGEVPGEDLHDEPHYYCQGDGLGVHPSTVAINDDADDEGNDSGSDASESSSSSGSVAFSSAENQSIHALLVVGQEVSQTQENNSTGSSDDNLNNGRESSVVSQNNDNSYPE